MVWKATITVEVAGLKVGPNGETKNLLCMALLESILAGKYSNESTTIPEHPPFQKKVMYFKHSNTHV